MQSHMPGWARFGSSTDSASPSTECSPAIGILTTNIAYGGVDRRTMYITESESGVILRATMPVAGKTMHSHQT